MGWLELLPLLRRVLPLLDRLAPMLEYLVAGRMGGRAAVEANSASMAEVSKTHTSLQSTLEAQRLVLLELSAQLGMVRVDADNARAQTLQLASKTADLARTVRNLLVITVSLVLLCLALLLVLVLRHR